MIFPFVVPPTGLAAPKIASDTKHKIIIIGAGPTALGAAFRLYNLSKTFRNTSITILEQHGEPGGLAKSERDDQGFLWDMGGHVIFSHYEYFNRMLDIAVKDWNQRQRAAYAFMMGSDGNRRFIPYPVQNNIEMMDKLDQQKCLLGREEIAKNPVKGRPANFDEWLLRHFGTGLCEVFMRKYYRKFWTVDPTEMSSVWVGERVTVPDIAKIKLKIAEYDNGTSVKDSAWEPNNVFRFPRYNGTGSIWQAVTDLLPRQWFKFRHKAIGIDIDTNSVIVETDPLLKKRKHTFKFDSLISTVPLDIFVNMITGRDVSLLKMKELTSQLVYTHTHLIGIGLTGQPPLRLLNKSLMYFPDSDSPFYRITVFSSYSDDHVPEPGRQWLIMCEVAEPKNNSTSEKWTKDHLIDVTINALISYGFINTPEMVISKYYYRLDHGYPVPSINREIILQKVLPWLESKGIFSRGWFGGWKYEVGNQDHSFMQGAEVIDRLLKGVREDTFFGTHCMNSRKDTRTFCNKKLLDYEFVIAHYNENLDWLMPIANHTHVYHKGTDLQPQSLPLNAWEWLPNIGRESHTYLYHIINNYDTLPEITVFLQGDGEELAGGGLCFRNAMDYIDNVKRNIVCNVQSKIKDWGRIGHYGKWWAMLKSGEIRRANLNLGEFFKELFGYPHPRVISACPRGCFAATRDMIKKHPIDFYKKAISFVDDHPNPEEGHYFERLWYTIFSPSSAQSFMISRSTLLSLFFVQISFQFCIQWIL